MFKKILIANRGEIALRIIRACHELGIKTAVVYSEADRDSLHVRFADEAVCIGPPPAKDSYLNIPRIIAAAEITNADAIHPGYGFLAENASFAEICASSGLTFIGPTSEMISQMGDKALARDTMKKAGVPVVPGSDGIVLDAKMLRESATSLGYPVMIKAAAGGGGRGMRIVFGEEDLEKSFQAAGAEAEAAFGSPNIYLEKFLEPSHHIEIQVMGDRFGNVVHFGERDCSIQRRHQKLIEESPSPLVDTDLRERIGDASVKGAKAVSYLGAGTLEFIVDEQRNFYFMEMNTRIQVEHPVTEEVTVTDLVKTQILVAAGRRLGKRRVKAQGHAIECRINAEDPLHDFRPSPGKITSFHVPGGFKVRVDTHAYAGYEIPPHYDSLIAKLIVHAPTRTEAIDKMRQALEEFVIEGVYTTIPFHKKVMMNDNFRRGTYDTGFIEKFVLND
jgi:acetyl-CoA carboxylase biotin carboxylase subunit